MPPKPPAEIPVRFYRSPTGREPVLEWLREMEAKDLQTIGRDPMRVQFRWPIGMPIARSLGGGVWELRSAVSDDRIARVMFCFDDGTLVVLHGFIKKTQKTPALDLELANAG